MDIVKALGDVRGHHRGSVVAIGNFDGVHLGHQALLKAAKDIAAAQKRKFSVLTFEPHPRALFRPDDPPFRITPEEIKAERFAAAGVDVLCSLAFDWDFASQSPQVFIDRILKEGLGAAHIVVGYDFCFGQLRKGNAATIEAAGLPVTVVDAVADEDESELSSSRVRAALRKGNIEEANHILGWEWEIRGPVVHGDKRGRQLGYPTANMPMGDYVHPAYGVYATRVQVEGEEEWRPAATNIGIRPMFERPEALVETFIFDFDREIYGRTLRIKPVKRLRGEAKFNSVDDLVTQMKEDCDQAREILMSPPVIPA